MSISRFNISAVPMALGLVLLACLNTSGQVASSTENNEATRDVAACQLQLADLVQFEKSADTVAVDFAGSGDAGDSVFHPGLVGWQDPQDKSGTPPPVAKRQPLTPGEKINRAFKSAFLTPTSYLSSAVGAAITEWREDDLPHKTDEDRVADFGSRFAIRFSTRATRTIFGSGVYPILFKQDPRYRPAGKKNPFKRALHAASRVFVTDDDDGNLEPNYSNFAGALTASALANIWEQSTPGHDRIGSDATFKRFARSFPSGMINNILFKEFLPDLIKIIRRK